MRCGCGVGAVWWVHRCVFREGRGRILRAVGLPLVPEEWLQLLGSASPSPLPPPPHLHPMLTTLACVHAPPCAAAAPPPPHVSEASARQHADGFVAAVHVLVGAVERLYAGVTMPKSDFSMAALWK